MAWFGDLSPGFLRLNGLGLKPSARRIAVGGSGFEPALVGTWPWVPTYDSILGRMNTHVPPSLMFTRGLLGSDPQR